MKKYNVTRQVAYSADQVYAIAADVASYKQFLPLTKRSTVRNRVLNRDGTESFDAEMLIVYKKLRIEEFLVSKVTVDAKNRTITTRSPEGADRVINCVWKITDKPGGKAEIDLSVEYSFKSKSLQFLLSGMLDLAVRKVMTAFEDRARELYGNPSAIA